MKGIGRPVAERGVRSTAPPAAGWAAPPPAGAGADPSPAAIPSRDRRGVDEETGSGGNGGSADCWSPDARRSPAAGTPALVAEPVPEGRREVAWEGRREFA